MLQKIGRSQPLKKVELLCQWLLAAGGIIAALKMEISTCNSGDGREEACGRLRTQRSLK